MRSKQLVKNLKKALKQDYLYSEEELVFMKNQLKLLEEDLLKTRNKPEGFSK
jgi:hypothetical protein|tara:strand:+ start:133 stop:288 length:156 start_codon:yes stop_codon:yes gene_type:complete